MGINSVGSSPYTVASTQAGSIAEQSKQVKEQDKQSAEAADENVSIDGDKFEKSKEYKIDTNKVAELRQRLSSKVDAFEKMVNILFEKQGIKYNESIGMKANLEELIASGGVSEEERLAAEEAVGEDGEWGVEQTAQRILDFAKAISGGDPSKIEMLKDAVKSGFSGAESVWGDKLPDICQKTYDRVMQGFDEWAKSGETPEGE